MNLNCPKVYSNNSYSNFYNNWQSVSLLTSASAIACIGGLYLYRQYGNQGLSNVAFRQELMDTTKGIVGVLALAGSLAYAVGHLHRKSDTTIFGMNDVVSSVFSACTKNRYVNSPFFYYPLAFTAVGYSTSSIVSLLGYLIGYHNGVKKYPLFSVKHIPSSEVKAKAKTAVFSLLLGVPASLFMYNNAHQWGGCRNIDLSYIYNNWGSRSFLSIVSIISIIGAYCARQNNNHQKQSNNDQERLARLQDRSNHYGAFIGEDFLHWFERDTYTPPNQAYGHWPRITNNNIKTTIALVSLLATGVIGAYFIGAYNDSLCFFIKKISRITPSNIENIMFTLNGAMAALCTVGYLKGDITKKDLLKTYGGCIIVALAGYTMRSFLYRLARTIML